jgi:hypothetical protein
MGAGRVFATAICAILVGSASSPCVLGQIVPAAERSVADRSGDPQPPFSQTTVGHWPNAGFYDLGLGQSSDSRWTASADFIFMQRVGNVPYILVETVPSSVPYVDLSKTAGSRLSRPTSPRTGISETLRESRRRLEERDGPTRPATTE